MRRKLILFSFTLMLSTCFAAKTSELIFIAAKNGIFAAELDLKTGGLKNLRLTAEIAGPQFLAVDPKEKFLFTLNTVAQDGKRVGMVSAFALNAKTGELKFINQQPSQGAGPTHLVIDESGKTVLVANYGGGSVAAFPVQKDGSLGPATSTFQHAGSSVNPQRQEGPHAHCINVDPANRFALSCDLGVDKVFVYRLDARKSILTRNDPPFASLKPGAGPRHLAFHPNGRFVYVINELDSTITGFSFDPKSGALNEIQTVSTLPENFSDKNTTAEIAVHPNGKFLYGSNRGDDSIVVFGISQPTGDLTFVQHQPTGGEAPRHFEIEPSGKFLLAANQKSGNIRAFRIDSATGTLSPTAGALEVEGPSCVKCLSK